MIQNLTPQTFQPYGSVSKGHTMPEATESDEECMMVLEQTDSPLYRTQVDTWLCCTAGKCILSLRFGDGSYRHFHLDRPVCIRSHVQFSLCAFRGEAEVCIRAQALPESMGTRLSQGQHAQRQLHIGDIRNLHYQEQEDGFLLPGESHPMPELTYVVSGTLHSVVDGQDTVLQQGEMVLYGPGQWHMQYSDIGVAPSFLSVSFDLEAGDLSGLENRKFKATPNAVTIVEKMLQEREKTDPYTGDMLIAQLNLLILVLLREAAMPAGKTQSANAVQRENALIRQAQRFISEHIREKLSVPLVAEKVDVSPSYFTVLFQKHLQLSPGEYIRRIKLQESKKMIRENNLNFTEIASALQYSTVHHFSRQFKEKFGITPTEYAKSVRK